MTTHEVFFEIPDFRVPQERSKLARSLPKVEKIVTAKVVVEVKDAELLKNFKMLPNQPVLVLDDVSTTD